MEDIQYSAEDDAAMEQFIREHVGSAWHSLGTAGMGNAATTSYIVDIVRESAQISVFRYPNRATTRNLSRTWQIVCPSLLDGFYVSSVTRAYIIINSIQALVLLI